MIGCARYKWRLRTAFWPSRCFGRPSSAAPVFRVFIKFSALVLSQGLPARPMLGAMPCVRRNGMSARAILNAAIRMVDQYHWHPTPLRSSSMPPNLSLTQGRKEKDLESSLTRVNTAIVASRENRHPRKPARSLQLEGVAIGTHHSAASQRTRKIRVLPKISSLIERHSRRARLAGCAAL